ncbi:MAG: hypothetical protein IKV80_06795 [Bacteroidales bacterium]|nr:hypothetical protein [Bacteroidales bacterium]
MYNFKTDEQGYLPLIQIRIMQVIMETFGRMVPLNADLFENIKGLNEDRLFSVVENELGIEIDEDRRRAVRTPDDIICLMGEVMTEDEIRIYYMKVTLINLRRKREEYIEDGFDTEDLDDKIEELEMELMLEENDEAKAIFAGMMNMFDCDSDSSEEGFDEYYYDDEECEDDEEIERKFRESLNIIAQTSNVEQIVNMYNEYIDDGRQADDLSVYKEVLALQGVSLSEMEDAEAIDNRLKIQYDVENNMIRCIE